MPVDFRGIVRVLLEGLAACTALSCLAGCSPWTAEPVPGPDKQGSGVISGAALGAGSGAVYGAQVASGTGPGAAIGAGFGALYGMLSGLGIDLIEEDQLARVRQQQRLRELLWVHEILEEHYARRLELHPDRDIFPADVFFCGDSTKLRREAQLLLRELGHLTRQRMPWSRLVVASYVSAKGSDNEYAKFLGKRRAQEIAGELIRAGVEPRRLYAQGVTVSGPVVLDPNDHPNRYRQAIEFIPLDY